MKMKKNMESVKLRFKTSSGIDTVRLKRYTYVLLN